MHWLAVWEINNYKIMSLSRSAQLKSAGNLAAWLLRTRRKHWTVGLVYDSSKPPSTVAKHFVLKAPLLSRFSHLWNQNWPALSRRQAGFRTWCQCSCGDHYFPSSSSLQSTSMRFHTMSCSLCHHWYACLILLPSAPYSFSTAASLTILIISSLFCALISMIDLYHPTIFLV